MEQPILDIPPGTDPLWWGYLHNTGTMRIRRYTSPNDVYEAYASPSIDVVVSPLRAPTIEAAKPLIAMKLKLDQAIRGSISSRYALPMSGTVRGTKFNPGDVVEMDGEKYVVVSCQKHGFKAVPISRFSR